MKYHFWNNISLTLIFQSLFLALARAWNILKPPPLGIYNFGILQYLKLDEYFFFSENGGKNAAIFL